MKRLVSQGIRAQTLTAVILAFFCPPLFCENGWVVGLHDSLLRSHPSMKSVQHLALSSLASRFGPDEFQSIVVDGGLVDRDGQPTLSVPDLLQHPLSCVRKIALSSIYGLGGSQVIPELELAFQNETDPVVLLEMVEMVSYLDSAELLKEVSKLLSHPEEQIRLAAVSTLAASGDRSWADAIAKSLGDASPSVRSEAAFHLGCMGARRQEALIAELLGDEDPVCRESGIEALVYMGDLSSASIFALLGLLEDDAVIGATLACGVGAETDSTIDMKIRGTAKTALWMLKSKESVPRLIELLEHPRLRADALFLLQGLLSESSVYPFLEYLANRGQVLPEDVAILAASSHPDALEIVLDRIPQLEFSEVAVVLSSARRGKNWEIGGIAASMLVSPDPDCRRAAWAYLGEGRMVEFSSAIVPLLGAQDRSVLENAAKALGLVGSHDHVGLLVSLLEDKDHGVRRSAAMALQDLGAFATVTGYLRRKTRKKDVRWSGEWPLFLSPENQALLMDWMAREPTPPGEAFDLLGDLARNRGDAIRPELVGFLETMMDHPNQETSKRSVDLLVLLKRPSTIELLVQRLLDQDEEDDPWAADLLGQIVLRRRAWEGGALPRKQRLLFEMGKFARESVIRAGS